MHVSAIEHSAVVRINAKDQSLDLVVPWAPFWPPAAQLQRALSPKHDKGIPLQGEPWELSKLIRRALAQSVSDPRPLEREPKQQNFNTCFNTFCFYTCLSFQQSTIFTNPFSFFCKSQQSNQFSTPILSPLHFFLQKSRTVLQLLLEQLFLVCTVRTRGCLSGSLLAWE